MQLNTCQKEVILGEEDLGLKNHVTQNSLLAYCAFLRMYVKHLSAPDTTGTQNTQGCLFTPPTFNQLSIFPATRDPCQRTTKKKKILSLDLRSC